MVHLDKIVLINVLALMVGVVIQRKATVLALKDILALIVNKVNFTSSSQCYEMKLLVLCVRTANVILYIYIYYIIYIYISRNAILKSVFVLWTVSKQLYFVNCYLLWVA